MPLTTDTTQTAPALEAVLDVQQSLFPGTSKKVIQDLFAGADKLFTGGYLDYQANDLAYHDFRHTLQVTVAFADLFAARQYSPAVEKPFTARQFEIGIATTLLHDSGYLKLRSDRSGTGAKYTFCHVLRSCALAAAFLPSFGFKLEEVDTVLGAIRSTGPSTTGMKLRFNKHDDYVLASMVATCDYVAQMAAEDYPDELEALYNEFNESDLFLGLPPAQRIFKSAAQLVAGTGGFWQTVVLPKLQNDFQGVYRFFNRPDGTNPYIDAIENNLAVIASRQPAPAA